MRSKVYVLEGQRINHWTIIEVPKTGKVLGRCDCGVERREWAGRFFEYKQCINCHIDSQRIIYISEEESLSRAVRYVYMEYKYTSKNDSRDFLLEYNEEFRSLILSDCYYCGAAPSRVIKKYPHQPCVGGIDRLNSSLGYFSENVVSCCTTCNMMKNTTSRDDFLNHIDKIRLYQESKKEVIS